jgi:hypothetical protein
VLDARGRFAAVTADGTKLAVAAGVRGLAFSVAAAALDRTGDPRLGGVERKGDFEGQRLAVEIIPADGSPARVQRFTGKLRVRVKGGASAAGAFTTEEALNAVAVE